ncbi:mesenchyme-specific cell surface glycoprotein-like isoform X2 [Hypomesus transpacificus]|uniref:mesenchyme-specific cell surface glycoprotein-like isoform X2 n=1 Tax=Hypomesus transpacificus TaxID=137520 RepID=UPI001F073A8C|nr:mesenchyme-specific cell surface glycoprotein-like isoform X2 [Hypomesus transpacificus]
MILMIRESRMTNASFWSLLLFSLCFHAACLPVVSPCEKYATVKTAAEDYRMESEVSNRLNSTVCGETNKPVCEENRETRSIINMVCRRHFKLSSVPRAKSLTKVVLTSLDCPCPLQRQRGKERGGPAGGERGSGGGQPGRGEAGQRGEGGAGRGEAGQRGEGGAERREAGQRGEGGAERREAGQRGEGGAGRGEAGQRGEGGAGRGGGHRDTRQLCRLKLSLESLKLCYQALASGHVPGT